MARPDSEFSGRRTKPGRLVPAADKKMPGIAAGHWVVSQLIVAGNPWRPGLLPWQVATSSFFVLVWKAGVARLHLEAGRSQRVTVAQEDLND